MPDDGFHGPKVCAIVGITYRQLDYWTRTNLVQASVQSARGSGTQRLYSYSDLLELKVIKRLLDAGISLQSARKAVDALRQVGDVASANLVLSGTQPVLAHDDDQLIDLLKGGQGVLNIVLPLAGVVEELDADIRKLERPEAPDGQARPEAATGTGG